MAGWQPGLSLFPTLPPVLLSSLGGGAVVGEKSWSWEESEFLPRDQARAISWSPHLILWRRFFVCSSLRFWMWLVGCKQSVTSRLETSRYRDFSQFFESIGLGLKHFGLEKKSRYRSQKYLVLKKSLNIGLENIWSWKKSRYRSRWNFLVSSLSVLNRRPSIRKFAFFRRFLKAGFDYFKLEWYNTLYNIIFFCTTVFRSSQPLPKQRWHSS